MKKNDERKYKDTYYEYCYALIIICSSSFLSPGLRLRRPKPKSSRSYLVFTGLRTTIGAVSRLSGLRTFLLNSEMCIHAYIHASKCSTVQGATQTTPDR